MVLLSVFDIFAYIDSLSNTAPWVLYLLVFLSPFVQEDTAVIGTASLTAIDKLALGPAAIAITMGLFFSDIWKYWIGWFALKNKNSAAFSKKELVLGLKQKIHAFPFTTLVAARFIPFTRIPSYIACGFFKMSYPVFCLFVAITAIMFVTLAFGLFHILGQFFGNELKWLLPVIGIGLVILLLGIHFLRSKSGVDSRL